MPVKDYPFIPEGGEWREFKANQIGVNNSFQGPPSDATTNPERPLDPSNEVVRFYVIDNRVLFIDIPAMGEDGYLFRSMNPNGAPMLGGPHTTDDWFTINISTFRYVNADTGIIHPNSPKLSDKPGFEDVKTLTPCTPGPIPCFGPNVIVTTLHSGDIPIKDVIVGDQVWAVDPVSGRQSFREVVWRGSRTVMASDDETTPVNVRGEEYSPLHRILCEGIAGPLWVQARWLAEVGQAEFTEQDGRTVEYHHVMLSDHRAIVTEALQAESLLNTPYSSELFGGADFPSDMSTVKGVEDVTKKDLGNLRAGFAQARFAIAQRPAQNTAIPVVV